MPSRGPSFPNEAGDVIPVALEMKEHPLQPQRRVLPRGERGLRPEDVDAPSDVTRERVELLLELRAPERGDSAPEASDAEGLRCRRERDRTGLHLGTEARERDVPVLGVDVSEYMLALAEEKNRGNGAYFVCQDMRSLKLAEPSPSKVRPQKNGCTRVRADPNGS